MKKKKKHNNNNNNMCSVSIQEIYLILKYGF